MLHHSSEGILEIAQECGVSNTANFYRLYKKYYGIAPGEERHRQAI
jgi:transcriptional regulator GlxA family with amidase domain